MWYWHIWRLHTHCLQNAPQCGFSVSFLLRSQHIWVELPHTEDGGDFLVHSLTGKGHAYFILWWRWWQAPEACVDIETVDNVDLRLVHLNRRGMSHQGNFPFLSIVKSKQRQSLPSQWGRAPRIQNKILSTVNIIVPLINGWQIEKDRG